jgi:hypothetical protein
MSARVTAGRSSQAARTVRLFALLVAACLLVVLPTRPAAAWGYLGHRVIAELATRQLDAPTRERIAELLALDGKSDLHEVANWADDVREGEVFRWTVPLHYINFHRDQCVLDEAAFCADGMCVSAAVRRFAGQLDDPGSSPGQRLEALSFLIHFVADAHQPLHAGWFEDKGGNTFQVRWQGKGSNLHSIWDYDLLQMRGLKQTEYVELLATEPLPQPGSLDPSRWVVESCQVVAEGWIYPPRRRLTEDYMQRALGVAEQRMRLAAARLAALLQRHFATPALSMPTGDAG